MLKRLTQPAKARHLLVIAIIGATLYAAIGYLNYVPPEVPVPTIAPSLKRTIGTQANVVALAPDGTTVATGGRDRQIRIWGLSDGRLKYTLPIDKEAKALDYSPDGSILVAKTNNTLYFWETSTGHQRGRFEDPSLLPTISFSADGKWLATSGANPFPTVNGKKVPLGELELDRAPGVLRMWDLRSIKLASEVTNLTLSRFVVGLFPNGRTAAIGTRSPYSGFVSMHNSFTGKALQRLSYSNLYSAAHKVAVTSNGRAFVSAHSGASFVRYDISSRTQEVIRASDQRRAPREFALSADARLGAMALPREFKPGTPFIIEVWNVQSGGQMVTLPFAAVGLAFSRDGHWLAGADGKGHVSIWQLW